MEDKSGKREEKEARSARREAERAERRQASLRRHTVACPHCGKDVLDHMTECPFCKQPLKARGYNPVDEKKYKKIKLACGIVFFAIAAAIAVVIIVLR